jgi:hypothetical protein
VKERIKRSRSDDFGPIHLSLDDIEGIVAILRKFSPPVTVTTRDWRLDDPAELLELGSNVNDLTIESASPRISARFTRHWSWIYVSDDSDESQLGIAEKIRSLLRNCQRPLPWFGTGKSLVAITAILVPLNELNLFVRKTDLELHDWLSAVAGTVTALQIGAAIRYTAGMGATISIRRRSHGANIFQRHKDGIEKLVIGLVCTAFGLLLKACFERH